MNDLPTDRTNGSWAILGDKAYNGPDEDTPGLRRITIKKKPTLQADITRNTELAKSCVPIECFFGRLKKLWKFTENVYRLDHKSFDEHFAICALLTNEHIKNYELADDDARFYNALSVEQRKRFEERTEKRRVSAEQYQQRKQRRLLSLE